MGDGVNWRFLNAAARGTSHERTDVPCQDDCFADVLRVDGAEPVLVAVASDGAGSAASAEEGSGLVCELLPARIEEWLRGGGTVEALQRDVVEQWIGAVRTAIDERAALKELTPRDFACTLVAALVGSTAAAFLQIGDGAIVAWTGETAEVIFWPDGGEYANMTFFTTDEDWAKHLHFEVRGAAFDEVALMTDGLQRLALVFESRAAHAPFFEPMFRALRTAPPGFATELEPSLVTFLGSEAVNARTDDDKSLVLATRVAGAADGAL
jgi:hypothetical protein